MSAFSRPVGNVILYGKPGPFDTRGNKLYYYRVREKDRHAYILPDSDAFPANQPRTYCGNGQRTTFVVGEWAKFMEELNALKW